VCHDPENGLRHNPFYVPALFSAGNAEFSFSKKLYDLKRHR
jgi:hypothetical protein